jgi:hypothetical protein
MKWSALATLFAAPLALAGALQADVIARTDKGPKGDLDMTYGDGYSGGTTVIVEEVVLIWVCMGGGSKTTTMNSMDAVTSAQSTMSTHTVSSSWHPFSSGLRYCRSLLEALQALFIRQRQ